MDNKNIEPLFKEIDEQIDGIVLHLLKKYALKNEFSPKLDAHLKEENEVETLASSI
ncbi:MULTISPECIES: hypothetical protein [Legionella]|uniref:Uncharacterized protein n=1 Tax=Legionella resiliens TaxID=2905958 RepID=A0ABS8X4I9_9GAMM|nr:MULTISPECIES: hypothetical protein [unclassified Legionella]MCE0722895.1 hypothetical protein [Legionella sp. 9fVS26]MCE3532048.1 hypothetical protein [Legionella sp. 8cVS16]QLZ68170.1 hypothetical protein FOLKNPGA_00948 [Legionella sp. PC1000]